MEFPGVFTTFDCATPKRNRIEEGRNDKDRSCYRLTEVTYKKLQSSVNLVLDLGPNLGISSDFDSNRNFDFDHERESVPHKLLKYAAEDLTPEIRQI
ncbi:hypothetical protein EVAR_39106_1 [Eumeta japonica]|uniref:Uncharacterized protein n=1 Tax=Eumeta variegata TaxID=151549 RepID=A0A4C1X831_EUMVA|nr:hypothetical protein EVAR_39106_1 [Eumeta japonica]